MKKSLMMEIIACPVDKNSPLELYELSVGPDQDNVIEGILFCNKCKRFYFIKDEIPALLPDDLRDEVSELDTLTKWKYRLPSKITMEGKPWHT